MRCVSLTHIEHILLDDGVHDDGHQHVEEDSGQVLDAVVEVVDSCLLWAFCSQKHESCRVMVWTRGQLKKKTKINHFCFR